MLSICYRTTTTRPTTTNTIKMSFASIDKFQLVGFLMLHINTCTVGHSSYSNVALVRDKMADIIPPFSTASVKMPI